MMKSPTPRPSSPYRRRRITWVVLFVAAAFIFFASTHDISSWSLPSYLKEVSFSSSVASKVGLEKAKAVNSERLKVQEIHGLLHFVTAYPNRRLNEEDGAINAVGLGLTKVDPTQTVDLRVFSPDGEDDWQQYVKTLREKYPLIVFSKSYCPFSQRAKSLLQLYSITPQPFIVELDSRPDGPVIQTILGRLTDRKTVPNVLLHGGSIGGSDDIHAMHEQHKLKTLLEEGGLKVLGGESS